jgi:hypothetical protein
MYRQEMRFRNKLVEYLTDWCMGNSHQIAPPAAGTSCLQPTPYTNYYGIDVVRTQQRLQPVSAWEMDMIRIGSE